MTMGSATDSQLFINSSKLKMYTTEKFYFMKTAQIGAKLAGNTAVESRTVMIKI